MESSIAKRASRRTTSPSQKMQPTSRSRSSHPRRWPTPYPFQGAAKTNEVPGVITKPQFLESIEFVTHAGPHFGERLFTIFDENNDEQIDWAEFQMAMHVLRGSEERLSHVFQAYDRMATAPSRVTR